MTCLIRMAGQGQSQTTPSSLGLCQDKQVAKIQRTITAPSIDQ